LSYGPEGCGILPRRPAISRANRSSKFKVQSGRRKRVRSTSQVRPRPLAAMRPERPPDAP